MGQQGNRDPYFTPPEQQPGGGQGQTPGRGRPYLEPPAIPQQPAGPQTTQPSGPPIRSLEERAQEARNQRNPQVQQGNSDLQQAVGSKSKSLVDARDWQRGSTTSLAIIGGTASGVLTEPLVKGTGLLTDRMAAVEGESVLQRGLRGTANLYRSQYDPVGIHSAQIMKEEALVARSFQSIETTFNLDKALVNKLGPGGGGVGSLTADELKHMNALKQGLAIKDDAKLLTALMERQTHLNPANLKALNATETGFAMEKIRALELSQGSPLITKAERGLLETRALSLRNIGELELAAKEAGAGSRWITGRGAWNNAKVAAVNLLGTGLVLGADHSVRDRMYGKDARSWESSSLSVPLAMALGQGLKGKALWSAGAIVSGHLLDNNIQAPSWVPDQLRSFSAFDAVPLGVAFAIPTKGKLARAGVVTAAWLAGNGAEAMFAPTSPGEIEDRARQVNGDDKRERTYSSMEKTVDSFRELGKRNEVILEQNLAQALIDSQNLWRVDTRNMSPEQKHDNQSQKLGAHRTTAALARAVGEHHLENGTRLKGTDRPTYILGGENLDMGAKGLFYLQMARNSVKGSRQMTELLMDKQVYGKKVTQEELADLDRTATKVDADINAILGKHDMESARTKLVAFLERGTTNTSATFDKESAFHNTFVKELNKDLGRNMRALRNPDGSMNADACTVVAKLLRDYALAKIAHGTYKMNHGNDPVGAGAFIFGTPQGKNEFLEGTNTPKGFDGALEAIQLAKQLDRYTIKPGNEDIPQLEAMANRLADEISAKAPGQFNNRGNNILNAPTTNQLPPRR